MAAKKLNNSSKGRNVPDLINHKRQHNEYFDFKILIFQYKLFSTPVIPSSRFGPPASLLKL